MIAYVVLLLTIRDCCVSVGRLRVPRWCHQKKKSNDYFYVNYNRGAQQNAVPIATIARSDAKDHVDLTTATDVNQNAQYVVDGRQLYVVKRAVSVDRLPTKGTRVTKQRQNHYQHTRQTVQPHRTIAYVNGGYNVEPTARTTAEMQPTGYYVANGGVAQVHAGPPTSARTANSYPKRWRTRRSLPADDFRPLSRASSGHLTTMSTKSNADSLYLRWSPSAQRRLPSDDVFLPPGTDHLDNVSRSSYVIVNNHARAPPRSYQKTHKAFTLPPRESTELGVSVFPC